ncbi:MAG TPA: hypothetical protein DCQ06_00060 [Myxococcales bacterium]|nr:hypothetical protein [Myxococcales bacterium]
MDLYRNRCRKAVKRCFTTSVHLGVLAALVMACWMPCRPLLAWRVQIQERTTLSAAIRVNQAQWTLHGTLLDGAQVGLGHATVSLRWAQSQQSKQAQQVEVLKTNHAGGFEFNLTDRMISHKGRLEVHFEGDARYGACSWTGPIEPSELPLGLRVIVPDGAIESTSKSVDVAVVAMVAGDQGSSVSVQMWLAGRQVHRGLLPPGGRTVVPVQIDKIVEWGPKTLRVRIVQPSTGRQAETSAVLVFRPHFRVRLTETSEDCQGDMRCLQAQVDVMRAAGLSVGAAQISLQLLRGDDEIDAATTDSKGRARLRFYGPRLAALYDVQEVLVHVATRSKSAADHSVNSNAVVVSVRRSAVEHWATSALLIVLVALVLAWARQRLRTMNSGTVAVTMRANTSLASGELAPDQRTICGQVIHSDTGQPTSCDIWLELAGERLEPVWDQSDVFRFERLAEGRAHLHVRIDEHRPLELIVVIPHEGGFDGCQLRPQGHRGWVREQFAAVLARRTRLVVDWRRHTPRRLEDPWMRRQRSGHDRIVHAVDLSDRALYGAKTDRDTALAAADALKEAERS